MERPNNNQHKKQDLLTDIDTSPANHEPHRKLFKGAHDEDKDERLTYLKNGEQGKRGRRAISPSNPDEGEATVIAGDVNRSQRILS